MILYMFVKCDNYVNVVKIEEQEKGHFSPYEINE
jgi:hypothetical protein